MSKGFLVYVKWEDRAFGVVYVVYPLVVGLRVSEFVDALDAIHGLLFKLFVVEESSTCVVGELAKEVLGLVSGACGLVVGVRVGCGVMLMVVGAETLPWGLGLRGRDVFAVSGGIPLLLCSFSYLLYEVMELVGFGGMQLCYEFVVGILDCFCSK